MRLFGFGFKDTLHQTDVVSRRNDKVLVYDSSKADQQLYGYFRVCFFLMIFFIQNKSNINIEAKHCSFIFLEIILNV